MNQDVTKSTLVTGSARAHEDIDDFLCAVCKSKSRSLFSRPLSITYELGALPTVAYRKHLFHGFHYSLTNATVFCTSAFDLALIKARNTFPALDDSYNVN